MAETHRSSIAPAYSASAHEQLSGQPALRRDAAAVLRRAAGELSRRLEEGDNLAVDVHGRREQVTLRLSLLPPHLIRVETVEGGGAPPDGSLLV